MLPAKFCQKIEMCKYFSSFNAEKIFYAFKKLFFSLLCVYLFAPCVLEKLDECVAWRLLSGVG